MAAPLRTPPVRLSFIEKLGLFPAACRCAAAGLLAVLRGNGSPTASWRSRFWCAALRTMSRVLNIRQQQYVLGQGDHHYEAFAHKEGFTPRTVALKGGAYGHWLGDKHAKNVIIFFPGGGYANGASEAIYDFQWDLLAELKAAGKDACIFCVTYGLTPEATYPRQQIQGVEAIKYIIKETGRSPSNIVLGGASAGGNLCLGILSHLSHPHPEIEPYVLKEPFAGLFLVAPWVSFDTTGPSVAANEQKDFICADGLQQWADGFLAGRGSDNYSEPLKAPAEWWKDLQARETLIVVGKDDVLFSGVQDLAVKMQSVCSNLAYHAAENEPHDAPLIWRVSNEPRLSEQEKRVGVFCREALP
ncbi:hypothetical protein KEM52_002892 [Ascosphaera acerosa]|nr:hypothetical protein KEM52_002892 [Ascosphaera acerosa]